MASSVIDICNLALGVIGNNRLTALTERSAEATECARFYDQSLDEALEAFDWPFARAFARGVSPSGVEHLPGYAYAYAVPSGCIAVRGIARSMVSEPSIDYTISTVDIPDGAVRVLHTNQAGAIIVYTRRETNVSWFSPLFVAAVAAKLAQYMAMPLTKSETKRDRAKKLYEETIEQAAVSVGNQGRLGLGADVLPDWLKARG